MKLASTNLTLFKPFKRLRHKASNSRDSNSALIHCPGGCKNLSQFLQNDTFASLGIPSVISTFNPFEYNLTLLVSYLEM